MSDQPGGWPVQVEYEEGRFVIEAARRLSDSPLQVEAVSPEAFHIALGVLIAYARAQAPETEQQRKARLSDERRYWGD